MAISTHHHAMRDSQTCRQFASLACAAVLILLIVGIYPNFANAEDIPPDRVAALQQALIESAHAGSTVDKRRAYKRVIRDTEDLLKACSDAPNRYAALATLFEAQKRLLHVEPRERNRDAIFETSKLLMHAPDEQAHVRFEADMLLTERELSENNATLEDRAEALATMVQRYRGTFAELQSLKIAALVAPKLMAFELEQEIQDTLTERFGGEHEAIQFRRNQEHVNDLDVVFSGSYQRANGQQMVFPWDRLGHQYLVVFWSKHDPGYVAFLESVKEQADRFSDRFEIYSFNVDELDDAGQHVLDKIGLKATAMKLPGGVKHSAYLAYSGQEHKAVLVNAQGRINLEFERSVPWPGPTPARGKRPASDGPGIGLYLQDVRYMAQLQAMLTGELLISTEPAASSFPGVAKEIREIDAALVPPSMRYRLSNEQASEMYRQMDSLATKAIEPHADTDGVNALRNRRIVALLGLWNATGDAAHLQDAAAEAKRVMANDPTNSTEIIAKYCLALQALRDTGRDPEKVIAEFVSSSNDDTGSPRANAAAASLALFANARTPYEAYRSKFLQDMKKPSADLLAIYGLLNDKHHQYLAFSATPGGYGYSRIQKYQFRYMVADLAGSEHHKKTLAFTLKGVNGKQIEVPAVASGDMLGVIWIEPLPDGKVATKLMQRTLSFAKTFTDKGDKLIVACLDGDAERVSSMLEEQGIACQVGTLPEGLSNPLVQELGVYRADRCPNLMLFRPDGTLVWHISGLEYHAFGGSEHAMQLAIRSNIEKIKSDAAFIVLEAGEYEQARQLFDQALPPSKKRDWWTADRYQGRALAAMGLQQWDTALTQIDAAIEQRIADFRSGICKCHGLVEMYLTKAMILEQLGRNAEAAAQRQLASEENSPHAVLPPGIARDGVPVGVYYDWLKKIRLEFVPQEQSP